MADIGLGIRGAAGGAAAGSLFGPLGTGLGAVLGGLGGLFGGGGDDDAQAAYERNRKMYEELLANYQGPENDPQYAGELEQLRKQGSGGLTPADKAAMLEAYGQAGQMARGREGAIEQQQLMRGGGVANSGQSAALQQQASQAGAQRAQSAGMAQAGYASQRALQARQSYLDTLARNKASLNSYRLAAAGGVSGSNQNMANFYGAQSAANRQGIGNAFDAAGAVGMYLGGRKGGGSV
jgi:hypothetical protein